MKFYELSREYFVTHDQMMEIDQLAVDNYGIELIQMMENGGRALARLALKMCGNKIMKNNLIYIFAGNGGNGGGALSAARRLHNYGAEVKVFLSKSESDFKEVPAKQLNILRTLNIEISSDGQLEYSQTPDLIIDGLIGYSLSGNPEGRTADFINFINSNSSKVLSLDIPSGVESTSGEIAKPAVKADATLTLALPKTAFLNENTKDYTGEIYLADISIPFELYDDLKLNLHDKYIFSDSDIIRIL